MIVLALMLLAAPAQDRVQSENHAPKFVPARIAEEGPGRFATPARVPEVRSQKEGLDLAPDAGMAVTIDRASGRVSHVPLTELALPSAFTAGRQGAVGGGEPADPSFTGDLTSIFSSSFPWSAQVQITSTDTSGQFTVHSGTLIDARHVITAGHVVHEGAGGNFMSSVLVTPAWDGDNDAFGNANWASLATFTGWTLNSDPDEDLGVIRLDRPLGFLTGWMGYSYTTVDSFFTSNLFNLAGYPDNFSCYPGAPSQLYYGFGSYDSVTPNSMLANASWSCGSNGLDGAGAYIIFSGGSRFVYGVHRVTADVFDPDLIFHKRINSGEYNFINQSFISGGYPSSQVDLLPLDVNVATGPVLAGTPVASLDYVVANMSDFDPLASTYTVDVYLSTDTTITTADTLIQTHSLSHDFAARSSVQVQVPVPPLIPFAVTDGTYYLGVILQSADARFGNNSSDGWDAAALTVDHCEANFSAFGEGLAGSGGFVPVAYSVGNNCAAGLHEVRIAGAIGGTFGVLWLGLGATDLFPVFGGHWYVDPVLSNTPVAIALAGPVGVPGQGFLDIPGLDVSPVAGTTLHMQGLFLDPGAVAGVSMTNGLTVIID